MCQFSKKSERVRIFFVDLVWNDPTIELYDGSTTIYHMWVLFAPLYFHELCKNCVVHENLIRNWKISDEIIASAIGMKNICEILSMNYQLATTVNHENKLL